MWSESCSVMSNSLQSHGLYSPWNSPGQNIGVGSLSLLQWIFPTQELNWGLLRCRQILYQLNYQGSPGDMLIGKYFLYTKQGHNKYWLSLLLPGFLHRLIFFPHSLCMFCFFWNSIGNGKRGRNYLLHGRDLTSVFPLWTSGWSLIYFRDSEGNLFNPFFWEWVQSLFRVRLFATPWTVAYQASQSMGFSRQKYWTGLPFPSPGDLPDPVIEPRSPTL